MPDLTQIVQHEAIRNAVPFAFALLTAFRQRNMVGLHWKNPYTMGAVAGLIWFPFWGLFVDQIRPSEALFPVAVIGIAAGAFLGLLACFFMAVVQSIFGGFGGGGDHAHH